VSGREIIGQDGRVGGSESKRCVRTARADDAAGLAELDAAAWSPESGFPSILQRTAASFFTPDNPPASHLVCEIDGQVVGYLVLRPLTTLPENAHVIGVFGLAVAPAARRLGAASALLAAAEQRARAAGARKLSLRVLGTNEPAIRLYDRLGFEREGVLRAEFFINGDYVDDLLMAKYLEPADKVQRAAVQPGDKE
jgi:ribosomal protein S18 acetylase RimI-like enzyme